MLMSLQAFQILNSKMLHDLISPNSAISNGIELLEEMGADKDCIQLIQNSSQNLKSLLTYYRIAYGNGGLPALPQDYYRELQKVSNDFFKPKHITFSWDEETSYDRPNYNLEIKLLSNLLVITCDLLPRGGHVHIKQGQKNFPFLLELTSDSKKIDPNKLKPILHPGVFQVDNDLDINNIRAYFAACLANMLHLKIGITENHSADIIQISVQ